jgi:hypothetical protein
MGYLLYVLTLYLLFHFRYIIDNEPKITQNPLHYGSSAILIHVIFYTFYSFFFNSYFSLMGSPSSLSAVNFNMGGGSTGLLSFSPNPQHLALIGFCTMSVQNININRILCCIVIYVIYIFYIID